MYKKDKQNQLTLESEYLIKKGKKMFDLDFNFNKEPKNKNSKICKKRTECLFTEFFKEMNYIYDSIHDSKKELYHYQLKKINTVAQIPKPRNFNSKGFPEDIRKHIEENAIYQMEYNFYLQDRNIKVYFVIESQDIDKSVEYFSNYIEKIMLWLSLIDKYASKKCSKTLTIYIYLTSLLKSLPSSNIDIISENHANTAFTYTCLPVSEIVIFRKEEWFKVILHETFHNFGLDFSDMNNDYCKDHMLSLFDVNSDVNLYESYTEFWAEIMNCLLTSFYLLKDKKDEDGFLEMSFFFIEYERNFSFFQMVKVLDFMGLRYQDLYSTTRQSQMKRNTFYKENTNVLAYYIIKTVLMNQYADFICWCDANHFSLLDFKKTMSHQREFCKYIENYYKRPSMLKNVHYFEDIMLQTNTKKNRFLKNNMRMTMIEMA